MTSTNRVTVAPPGQSSDRPEPVTDPGAGFGGQDITYDIDISPAAPGPAWDWPEDAPDGNNPVTGIAYND